MRIVVVSEWFSEHMGYTDNCLPKALASLGHEVHLVTSTLKPYGTASFYDDVYAGFLGPAVVEPSTHEQDGFVVHRLAHFMVRDRIGLRGLAPLLRELRPDVVQALSHSAFSAVQVAVLQPRLRFRLFTANHVLPSVFPPPSAGDPPSRAWRLRTRLTLGLPGRFVAWRSERCYAATQDAVEVANEHLGVPLAKLEVATLGVDTDVFHPVQTDADEAERAAARAELGFEPDDIVCMYTGRLAPGKDPACLAAAIALLGDAGESYRGLFIGEGPQDAAIRATPGCTVIPFVPFPALGRLHRGADIGVWPRQESMSVLDATASGLPVIISDAVVAGDRLQANASTYAEGDPASLATALRQLDDGGSRRDLGCQGAAVIVRERSWRAVAERRVRDYEAALGSPS